MFIALGGLLFLLSLAIVLMGPFKAVYESIQLGRCGFLCPQLWSLIRFLYFKVPLVQSLWNVLPDPPPDFWYAFLLTPLPATCIYHAVFFGPFTFATGTYLWSLTTRTKNDAFERGVADTFPRGSYASNMSNNPVIQISGPINAQNAQGPISVEQKIENVLNQAANSNPNFRRTTRSFSKTPLGLIIIGAIGSVVAIVIGQIILINFGLVH